MSLSIKPNCSRLNSTKKQVNLGVGCRRLRQRARVVSIRADRDGSGGSFMSGFVFGGVIFGTLGFLFAPQISRALLNEEQKLRLPRWLEEEEKDPEATKQKLFDKIDQLNEAIDEISSNIKQADGVQVEEEAAQVST
eukprot:TRINITY_DN5180_c0_g1_i10.p3 TRINITY_DN5180_c0_g1~~TRINITY_DN5180_c0_g1_i10.p3  ORF type:complete len:137 (+),score=25.46 TRINITY_DN5180_c0_g1_i10:45-455(+)